MRTSRRREVGTSRPSPAGGAVVGVSSTAAPLPAHRCRRGDRSLSTTSAETLSQNDEAIPYQGEQPYGMLDDLIVPKVLDFDCDERLWVPQAKDVSFRP